MRLAGTGDLQRTTVALDDAGDRLSRYFIIQALLNSAFGVFIGACLWAMGLPNPVLWGFLAGLMRFVPFIGSIIAGVFPIILAAAIDPGWSLVLWTAALFVVSEVVAGEVIEPMLYGRNTGLSPVAVVVATLFWTLLWGPVGLILATPMTVCLMVLGKHVNALNFLEVLFGDEPALEPHERLYQRVLAGDGIEAIEVAEQSLKDLHLIQYYDDVAIKALAMAYADAASGRLSRDDISEIKDAVEDVVAGLSEHLDEEASAAKKKLATSDVAGEVDVLCIHQHAAAVVKEKNTHRKNGDICGSLQHRHPCRRYGRKKRRIAYRSSQHWSRPPRALVGWHRGSSVYKEGPVDDRPLCSK